MFHLPIAQLDFQRFWYSSINSLAAAGGQLEVSTCRSLAVYRPGQQPGFELSDNFGLRTPVHFFLACGLEAYQHILPPQLRMTSY